MAARAALLVVLSALPACAGPEAPRSSPGPAPRGAEIAGTVLDASSREPVAGVEVLGPEGTRARTDRRGRFLLTGLREGGQGQVVARAADGREARNPLRPLRAGRVEIVLHLVWR